MSVEAHEPCVYPISCQITGARSADALTIIPTSCSCNWGIELWANTVRRPQSNDFIERLHRTMLDEHFLIKRRTTKP